MSKVIVLPAHIASQIAAGEVIERPASVVKELVENSIDAGATVIEIAADAGCLNLRVADNGCGMDADDAVLAFHRHATSKLSSADDLWKLTTMGFRGEALPSIAAVSRLTCYTRTAADGTGLKLESADGTISGTRTGCAAGTVVEVNDLFYNVPARLQFLKKAITEFAHIQETVEALAIANLHVSFSLLKSGQKVFKTSGSQDLSRAVVEAGFLRSTDDLHEVRFKSDGQVPVEIYGYVARPTTFRGDRKGILTVVNNRPVRCFITHKALDYVFSDLIPRGRFPVAVLNIKLDPAQVDVNVHPGKKEIRYVRGNEIYAAVQHALMKAVRGSSALVEQLERQFGAGQSSLSAAGITGEQLSFDNRLNQAPAQSQYARYETDTSAAQVAEPDGESPLLTMHGMNGAHSQDSCPTRFPVGAPYVVALPALPAQWRLAGYLHNTYFLVESPSGLELIEQHIAHERVLYERLLAVAQNQSPQVPQSQRLITSLPLKLTTVQLQCLQANIDTFRQLGFDFEFNVAADSNPAQQHTDDNNKEQTRCTEVPLELAACEYTAVLQQMLENLESTGNTQAPLTIVKSLACQSAVKNGMPLSEKQIVELIGQWYATPRNDTCPHGRPIKLSFSKDQLFRMFHPA